MKIKIIPILTLIFFSLLVKGQVYEAGNILFDVYAGGPNLYSAILRTAVKEAPNLGNRVSDIRSSSSFPFVIKGEYLFSNRIGVGLNINYANSSLSGTYRDSTYTNNVPYDIKFSIRRLRVFPTFNIHMGSSEKLDPYFSFGLGYNNLKLRTQTNAPNIPSIGFSLPFPIAVRLEFGLRYFVTKNFGFHFQLGLGGGPFFALGLSTKF